jgi:hypothetical protein
MASPFSIFRKNQRVGMALLTIVAIIGFVFLGALQSANFGRSSSSSPVVVHTEKFGDLRLNELQEIERQRLVLFRFAGSLGTAIQQQSEHDSNAGQYGADRMNRIAEAVFGQNSQQAAIDRWMFSKEAAALKIDVSQKSINDFLAALTEGRLNGEQIAKAVTDSGTTEGELFAILRDEVLAMRAKQMFTAQWLELTITPGHRWDYFKRFNQSATVEVAKMKVQGFVAAVKDPSEQELRSFFNERKAVEGSPDSATAGFREPHKVRIEYLFANTKSFMDKVTDAEVQEEFEKNKERYEETIKSHESADKAAAEAKGGETNKPATKAGEPAKSADTAKPAISAKPADTTKQAVPAQPADSAKPASGTPPAESMKPADSAKPADTAKPADSTKSPAPHAANMPNSPFRLAAYDGEPKKDDPKSSAVTKEDPKKETIKKEEIKKEEPKKSEPAKDDIKKDSPKKDDSKKDADKKDELKKDAKDSTAAAKPKKSAREEVMDGIRRELAERKLQAALDKAGKELEAYRLKWIKYDAERGTNSAAKQPAPPNFAKIAEGSGLSSGSTGLVSEYDLESTDLGKSSAVRMGFVDPRLPYRRTIMQSAGLYTTNESGDYAGNRFLSWKTDDVKSHVPKFTDPGVKDQVLRSWKEFEARKLAKDQAIKMVQEANQKKQSLKELYAGRKDVLVVNPPSFTWLTFGDVPPGMSQAPSPELNSVVGLPDAGNDFMKATFALSIGKVDYAFSRAGTEVYIVRMLGTTPVEDMWQLFHEGDPLAQSYMPMMRDEQMRAGVNGFFREFYDYVGYKRESLPAGKSAPETPSDPSDSEE